MFYTKMKTFSDRKKTEWFVCLLASPKGLLKVELK